MATAWRSFSEMGGSCGAGVMTTALFEPILPPLRTTDSTPLASTDRTKSTTPSKSRPIEISRFEFLEDAGGSQGRRFRSYRAIVRA